MGGWFGAVAGGGGFGDVYEAVSGIGGGELYAGQVFGTLERGARATTRYGEWVELPAQVLGTLGGVF